MDELLELEQRLSFKSFDHEDCYQLALNIINKVKENNLKNIRIRIVLNNDIVFQYLMNGKNGEEWLNRKQKTLETFKHSTYYIYLENEATNKYQQYLIDNQYAICGGGFPIRVNHEIVGCVIVSGLAHDQDHQLIVDGLLDLYKRKES